MNGTAEGFLLRHRRLLVIAVPMIWLLVFFLAPFLVVFKLSFSEAAMARPPYLPLTSWEDGRLIITLNLDNYHYLIEDKLYLLSFLSSIRIAAISTILALLIGYPMAWHIARAPEHRRNLLLMLVILPFWTSFLLRVYAWIGLLRSTGVINNALISLGLINEPLVMLQTNFAVYIGIVYTYLPFMILPLFATLSRLDSALLEAASDLGAKPGTIFFTVILPLSLPGIIAGSMLVFIPAIGEFVIPALLGGPDTLMIGKVLWTEFFNNRDWPVASAVAMVLIAIIVLPVVWLRRVQKNEEA
jgi:putrescine transport system permease protein